MAQRTEVETAPYPSEGSTIPSETRSAASPPSPSREGFLQGRPRTRILLILAIVLLLVAGFFVWRYWASYETTDDAQIDGHLMPLSPRIAGYILKVNVDDNQYVKAGTVLAEIDPKDYQVAVDKAQADVADAKAT